MNTSKKIPVLLVTGFLGSGKTTLLRHLATNNPERRMVFLVNEFAETDVDGEFLRASGSARPTHSVIGGSLFCECKAGEFVRVMKENIAPLGVEGRLDLLVIETSGIADPEAIGRIMADFGLSELFEIAQIVSVVSPLRFMSLIANMRSIEAQIRTSDYVLINKIDLASDGALKGVEEKIRSVNPRATILRTERSEVDLPIDFGGRASLPLGKLSTCDSNPFTTKTVRFEKAVSVDLIRKWFKAIPPEILRLKGSVLTEQGWFSLSRSIEETSMAPSETEGDCSALVLIALDEDEGVVEEQAQLLKELESGGRKRAS